MSTEEKKPYAERYLEARREVEAAFTPDRRQEEKQKTYTSPSGRYTLKVTPYNMGKGYWEYTLGEVFDGDKLVTKVHRNYGVFEYAWVEGHADGHDYLVCGEDYQGQTVIRCDTGERADSRPQMQFDASYGFCWAGIRPNAQKNVLAVDGCYWAAPYEVVLYDFREPLKFPLKELLRADDYADNDKTSGNFMGKKSWAGEGILGLTQNVHVRKSDGADVNSPEAEEWYDGLSATEQKELTEWRDRIVTWTPYNLTTESK